MKRIYLLVTISLFPLLLWGQEPQFTHYMYNTLSVNPAYAGSRDVLTVTALNRAQWLGVDGAPLTQTFSVHTPVMREKVGLGLSIVNDKIGPVNFTRAYGNYAYRIDVGRNAKLALGISAGLNIQQNRLTDLKLQENGDVVFEADENTGFLPNFGLGIYFSTDEYYLGLSAPKLLHNESETSKSYNFKDQTYAFIAGGAFEMNSDFMFKPSLLVKMDGSINLQADLSAIMIFRSRLWGGLMYRTNNDVGALAGFFISPQLKIGYSYDMSVAPTAIRTGSHEIMLMYDIEINGRGKIKSSRYF